MDEQRSLLDFVLGSSEGFIATIIVLIFFLGSLFYGGVLYGRYASGPSVIPDGHTVYSYEEVNEIQKFWYTIGVFDYCWRLGAVSFGVSDPAAPEARAIMETVVGDCDIILNLSREFGWYESALENVPNQPGISGP